MVYSATPGRYSVDTRSRIRDKMTECFTPMLREVEQREFHRRDAFVRTLNRSLWIMATGNRVPLTDNEWQLLLEMCRNAFQSVAQYIENEHLHQDDDFALVLHQALTQVSVAIDRFGDDQARLYPIMHDALERVVMYADNEEYMQGDPTSRMREGFGLIVKWLQDNA